MQQTLENFQQQSLITDSNKKRWVKEIIDAYIKNLNIDIELFVTSPEEDAILANICHASHLLISCKEAVNAPISSKIWQKVRSDLLQIS